MIVTKFGGTSMANPVQMRKVKGIIEEAPQDRRVVVVSAPGKDGYIRQKVTDLLLHVAGENPTKSRMSYLDAVTLLQDRFSQLCRTFNLPDLETTIHSEIDALSGKPRDFIAS